jgi:hypothetical protein
MGSCCARRTSAGIIKELFTKIGRYLTNIKNKIKEKRKRKRKRKRKNY